MKKKPAKIDFSKMKFGRLPVLVDTRTFQLSDYLSQENMPRIPKKYNWGKKIKRDKWGDLGNLKINNCTCAVAGHSIMSWTSNTGRLERPKYDAIIKAYSAVSGYDPNVPEKDEGVEAIKLLKYWRKNEISGHQIVAFAKLEEKNRQQLLQTIYLFGGCYVGINLPKSAERQYNTTKKWTIPRGGKKRDAKKGSWFGHAVLITGYKGEDLRIITWGEEMIMTMDFWEAYSEESYAVFSETFIKNEKTPTGIDVDILRNDIEKLKKKSGCSNPLTFNSIPICNDFNLLSYINIRRALFTLQDFKKIFAVKVYALFPLFGTPPSLMGLVVAFFAGAAFFFAAAFFAVAIIICF